MRRQSLKEQKRLEIIRAACRLFSERGYYNYSESKEELAREIMITVSDWVAERLRKVNETETGFREKIELLVRSFLR